MRQQESEDAEHMQKNKPLIQTNTSFADDEPKPDLTASSMPHVTQEQPPRLHRVARETYALSYLVAVPASPHKIYLVITTRAGSRQLSFWPVAGSGADSMARDACVSSLVCLSSRVIV